MTLRSLHSRYSASAVATIMSTIRSTPLMGGAVKRTRTGSEPFVELWRVRRGDVRVGVMASTVTRPESQSHWDSGRSEADHRPR